MKKCPNCKKNMSDSSAFCDICGTPLKGVSMEDEISNVSTIPTVPEKKSSKSKSKKKPKGRPRMEPPKEPSITPQTEPATIPSAKPKMPKLEKVVEIDHYHPETLEEEPFVEKVEEIKPIEKKTKSKKKQPPKEEEDAFVEIEVAPAAETVAEVKTIPVTAPSKVEEVKPVETVPTTEPKIEEIKEVSTIPDIDVKEEFHVAKIVTEPPKEEISVAKIVTEPPKEEITVAKIVKETTPATTPTIPPTQPATVPPTQSVTTPVVVTIPEIKTNPVTLPEIKTSAPTVPSTKAVVVQPPITAPLTQPITAPAPTVPIVTTPAATIPVIVTTPVVTMPPTVAGQPAVMPTVVRPPVQPAVATTPVAVQPAPTPQVVATQPRPVVMQPVAPVQPQAPVPQQTIPQSLAALYGEPTRPFQMTPTVPTTAPTQAKKEEKDSKATSSIILGVASLILCGFLPISITGFVLAYIAKIDMKKRKIGMILNAISIVYGTICLILFCSGLTSGAEFVNDPNKVTKSSFVGTGYTITYDGTWEKTTLSGGTPALKYDGKPAYLSPIGQSKLSDTVSCDFEDAVCKTTTYDEFYEYWRKDIDQNLTLSKDSPFKTLKDKIYYATYNYSLKSTGELKGKYYLLVSKENDMILSFLTNADEDYLSQLNPEVITLLENIKLNPNKVGTGTTKTIESASTWNDYPELRSNIPLPNDSIYGEYRILSNDSKSYWIFKRGEFWWYKDEQDLNDNYWYGTMAVANGKKGIKSIGLPESKLEELLDQYQGKVKSGDIYSIVMKPQKVISNHEDKTATNLPKGQELRFIWIIVDHGDEGIEAQVLNVDSEDTDYFVKVKD